MNPIKAVKEFDCLMICGGGDLHPRFYGEQPYCTYAHYDDILDNYEINLINTFIEYKKPVLGICRGMQSLNVALGGTLIQDIPHFLKTNHQSSFEKECLHEIKIQKKSELSKILGIRTIVNSHHHQCINSLGKNLKVIALAHDGVIEAIEGIDIPVLGVQWHPERMSGNDIFDYFERLLN